MRRKLLGTPALLQQREDKPVYAIAIVLTIILKVFMPAIPEAVLATHSSQQSCEGSSNYANPNYQFVWDGPTRLHVWNLCDDSDVYTVLYEPVAYGPPSLRFGRGQYDQTVWLPWPNEIKYEWLKNGNLRIYFYHPYYPGS